MLILLLLCTSVENPIMAASNENTTTERSIVTTGYAKLTAVPDIATITIGVQYTDSTVIDTQAEVAKRMEAVLATLRKAGIPSEAIRTSTFRVSQDYYYKDGQRIFTGYTVNHSLSVTINDLSLLGVLLDAVVSAGATNISDIEFHSSKAAELQLQALQTAVADARQKAKVLAAEAGTDTIRIIRIQDSSPQIRQFKLDSEEIAGGWLGVVTEVSPGEVTISTSVIVEFAF